MDEQEFKPDVVSIGIEINKSTHLRKINQHEPLKTILRDICRDFDLGNEEKFSLQFDNHEVFGYNYVSEENRVAIKDGSICKLVHSPSYVVQSILARMVSPGAEENIWSLRKFIDFVKDKLFVEKFVEANGVTILVTILQGNALSYDAIGYAFKCLSLLMAQGYVPITSIKDRILEKVIHNILSDERCSSRTQESCLSIVNYLMKNHSYDCPNISKTISMEKLISFLNCDDHLVKTSALGVINSKFNVSTSVQRRLFIKCYGNILRDNIYKNIILKERNLLADMIQELAMFQSQFVSKLRRKAETPVDLKDNLVKKRISMLAKLSMKDDTVLEYDSRRNTFIEMDTTLLTDYVQAPPIVKSKSPPSILILSSMTYFIENYQQNYARAVLAHSLKTYAGSDYPFMKLCTQLITLLTDCLGITTTTTEGNIKEYLYHPVLFAHAKAFEELFCATIMVFSKTVTEMRAKKEDYTKVINVVQKKIQVTLNKKPVTLTDFNTHFYKVSYNSISNMWQDELEAKQTLELREKKSLVELKQELKPQYVELIKQQRMNAIIYGSYVKYYSKPNKIKDKQMYAKYIQNEKIFVFTDETDARNNFNIELSRIKSIAVGKNCTHVKVRGSKLEPEFAFALWLKDTESNCVNLAATSKKQMDYILDAFKILLNMDMVSDTYEDDLQSLIDMHIRLELLDAFDVELPNDEPPPIPNEPPNYDFLGC